MFCGRFCALSAELSSWDRDHATHKDCNIDYLGLCRKSVPAPAQGRALWVTLGRSPSCKGFSFSSMEWDIDQIISWTLVSRSIKLFILGAVFFCYNGSITHGSQSCILLNTSLWNWIPRTVVQGCRQQFSHSEGNVQWAFAFRST